MPNVIDLPALPELQTWPEWVAQGPYLIRPGGEKWFYCGNCGAEADGDLVLCPECGAAL